MFSIRDWEAHNKCGKTKNIKTSDITLTLAASIVTACIAIGGWLYFKNQPMLFAFHNTSTESETTGFGLRELPLPHTPTLPSLVPPRP